MAHDDQSSPASVQPTSLQPQQSPSPDVSMTSSSNQSPETSPGAVVNAPVSQPDNRAELIERARSFLISPQIRHEDVFAKRRFLVEKGLSDPEIAGLLQGLARIS